MHAHFHPSITHYTRNALARARSQPRIPKLIRVCIGANRACPRSPMAHRPVSVELLTTGVPIIMGGSLGKEDAWVPSDLVSVGGDRIYLKLSKSCAKFRSLCGTMLRFDKYLDGLMEKRDIEVKRILKDMAIAANPLGQYGFKVPARDVIRGGAAPEYVVVSLPVIEGSEPVNAKLLFTYDPKCCVAVLLEDGILDYIVTSIRDGLDERGRRGAKRPLEERIKFDSMPEVRWNYTRSAAYVKYKDADNVEHTRHMKAGEYSSMNDDQRLEERQKVAEELRQFYIENHYPIVCGAAELGNV